MDDVPAKLQARALRKQTKRQEKKQQIAESAIAALKELGYANTSLRDIADRCELSLGMLHYYFEDRSDLIIYCISVYKRAFIGRIGEAIAGASGRDEVIDALAKALVASIVDDEMIHRLWYDIRTQAMFDPAFRPAVQEIEAELIDAVRGAIVKAGPEGREDAALSYALLDGLFRYLMQGQIGNAPQSREALLTAFRGVLARLL